MGLDISYYKNIRKLDCVFDADGEPIDPKTRVPIECDHFSAYVNIHFPQQAEGLEDKAVYLYDERFGFRAGSYYGYNQWRETLARIAGYSAKLSERHGATSLRHDAGAWKAKSGPFHELIHFSDCEGSIGAKVSAKLAADFAAFQPAVDASATDDYFKERYGMWRTAFETAAQNGAVDFH
jgi:hypothetical protein